MAERGASAVLRALDDKGVLLLTLHRPWVRNALTTEVSAELSSALDGAEADSAVRCVVLTGTGSAFCSGQDQWAEADLARSVRDLLGNFHHPLIERIARSRKPIVSALNGPAAGIGASIALATDIRVASTRAQFIFGFAKLGLVADGGVSYFLPRIVGPGRAAELMLLGGSIGAEHAEAVGLVTAVVEPADLMPVAMETAALLADAPAGALALIKRQLLASHENTLTQQLELEIQTQSEAAASAAYSEGRSAFSERRLPNFRAIDTPE